MLEPESPYEQPWERQRLRVPREDRTVFVRPSLSDAVDAVGTNAALLDAATTNIQGRTLQHMREWAKRSVLKAAVQYTQEITGESVESPPESSSLIMDGHQPSLFHPGVWIKNFAIHEVARRTNRTPLHFLVDNDTLSTSELNVPAGDRERPQIETVPFDAERRTAPWEEAGIRDAELFRSFGRRVSEIMHGWGIEPLMETAWTDAVAMSERGAGLVDCFTAMRHRLERRWGVHNLELPLSHVSALDPFLWFAGHLFAQAGRFREVHNRALNQFRKLNHVRSRTHPVPELVQDGEWTESPFWIWKAGEHIRRRTFVRQVGREVELTDRDTIRVRFPLSPEMDACCAVEVLRELPRQGIRLRTRALTTTLFARLFLSDLFIHGIGGSKYDEMTDRIIARFYGMPAPTFLTLSATVFLPLAEPFAADGAQLCQLQQQLRDLHYDSDRSLDFGDDERWNALVREKRQLIAEQQSAATEGLSRRERRARAPENHHRYRRLQEVTAQLEEFARAEQDALRQRIGEVELQLAANQVLKNREFSFCLYPESTLREFLFRSLQR